MNVLTAMKGEAFAHAFSSLFGTQADSAAHAAVGRLIGTAAQTDLSEHLHAAATLAGVVGTNAANLRQAINGGTYEDLVMYRGFAAQARRDGDTKAADLFTEIAADEGRLTCGSPVGTATVLAALGGGTVPRPEVTAASAVRKASRWPLLTGRFR
ncbi:ferritin family protein [Streptomyces sp. NPDC001135]